MKPIINESLRVSIGDNKTIRLFAKFIDNRWLVDNKKSGMFLVVCYDTKNEKYIPKYDSTKTNIDKLHIWDDAFYNEMAGNPKIRNKKEQIIFARTQLQKTNIERYWFDNFKDAQDKFIILASSKCNNIEEKLTI